LTAATVATVATVATARLAAQLRGALAQFQQEIAQPPANKSSAH
jgi:hypothetical protein